MTAIGTAKASDLVAFHKRISPLVSECLVVNENGAGVVKAMHDSNVCMVRTPFPAVSDRPFAIDIAKFATVIKAFDKDDSVELDLDGAILTLRTGRKVRKLATLHWNRPAVNIRDLSASAHATIDAADLTRACKALFSLADYAVFTIEEGGLRIEVNPNEHVGETTTFGDDFIECDASGSAKSLYSFDLLLAGLAAMDGPTRISFQDDFPMTVDDGTSTFVLAPRIEQS